MTRHQAAITTATILAVSFVPALSWASEPADDPIFALPFNAQDCGLCYQQGCEPEEHGFQNAGGLGSDRAYSEGDHGCEGGWCSVAHPQTCPPSPVALTETSETLWRLAALHNGTPDDLRDMLLSEAASYNASRKAVQVRGCDDSIILNIPLTADQVASLSQ